MKPAAAAFLLGTAVIAAEPAPEVPSPPLERFDPVARPPASLVRVLGNPRGVADLTHGYRIQRLPGQDRWLVESGWQTVVVGIDRKTNAFPPTALIWSRARRTMRSI